MKILLLVLTLSFSAVVSADSTTYAEGKVESSPLYQDGSIQYTNVGINDDVAKELYKRLNVPEVPTGKGVQKVKKGKDISCFSGDPSFTIGPNNREIYWCVFSVDTSGKITDDLQSPSSKP